MNLFSEYGFSEQTQKALDALSFTQPTSVQKAVLDIYKDQPDIMVCAETGSGKTAAYILPILERLIKDPTGTALILAPTRELVHQIADFAREAVKYTPEIKVASLVGGAEMRKQINSIKRKPRIFVATPGRLIDHLKRKSLKLNSVRILVLDEGDRMLDMGFAPQLDQILSFLPEKRQTMLFTATLPKKVQGLAQNYLSDPKLIQVGRESLPVEKIKQSVVQLVNKEKNERVLDEINRRKGSIIVFLRTKTRTDDLTRYLKGFGVPTESLHGDKTQGQRNKAIRSFKEGKIRILCATDIAARGLDVPEVEHVINFDLPRMDEDYVHRIGRTARNGAEGEAISFVTPSDHKSWLKLAKKYRIINVDLVPVKADSKGKSSKRPSRLSNKTSNKTPNKTSKKKRSSSSKGRQYRKSSKSKSLRH